MHRHAESLHVYVAVDVHSNLAPVGAVDRAKTGLKVEPHEDGKLKNEVTDVWCACVNGSMLIQGGFISILN